MENNDKNIVFNTCCNGCGNQNVVDFDRIITKLNAHFRKKEFDQVDRLLNYWLCEARNGNDKRSELQLLNEYMGFSRKQGRKEEAIMQAEKSVELLLLLNMENTVDGATILLNVATVYNAFDNYNLSMQYFNKAKIIYEDKLDKYDKRLAGLYNNMGLTAIALNDFIKAEELYKNAIDIMMNVENGELDLAVSYLNLADLYNTKNKIYENNDKFKYENEINELIEKAYKCLNLESTIRDGYYEFVCEKCYPIFGFYGYFIYENEIKKRAEAYRENI